MTATAAAQPAEDACGGRAPAACREEAARLALDDAEAEHAAQMLQRACSRSDAEACRLLGAMALLGRGTARQPERAVALFETACESGNQGGCADLAMLVAAGEGTFADVPRAITLLEGACSAHVARACGELGRRLREGDAMAPDAARAERLSRTACEGGHGASCVALAHGGAADAPALLEHACLGGALSACTELASALRATEPTRAAELFGQACERGTASACNELGTGYGPCEGDVLPTLESCETPEDDDCDGKANEGCFLANCLAIKMADPDAPDGPYAIDLDGDDGPLQPFQVLCDMTIAGGGWTRFNWLHTEYVAGLDPLGQALPDCKFSDLHCRGRIPAGAVTGL